MNNVQVRQARAPSCPQAYHIPIVPAAEDSGHLPTLGNTPPFPSFTLVDNLASFCYLLFFFLPSPEGVF